MVHLSWKLQSDDLTLENEDHNVIADVANDNTNGEESQASESTEIILAGNSTAKQKKALKRRRKERETGKSSELSDILTKFIEASEESSAKRFAIEAELEEKRREQERKHEERMMRMMMEFVCQMRQPQHNYPRPSHGSYGQSSPSVLSSPSAYAQSSSPYTSYQSTFPSPTGHGQSTHDFNHGVNGDEY